MDQDNKRIAVEDVRIGMYVEALDKPWLETDYLIEGVKVESDDDIARLRSMTDHVWISTQPSDFETDQGKPYFDEWARALAEDRRPADFKDELVRARAVRVGAIRLVGDLYEDVAQRRPINVDGVQEAVTQMMASVARHPDALVWFTNLKHRDAYTAEHSLNVSIHSVALATRSGLPDDQIRDVGVGALLHDIGKIRVPDAVLNKPGALNDDEHAEMKRHVEYGVDMLQESRDLSPESLDIVHCHHERLDGSGYPRGLVGEDISRFSRLIAIADVYDAVTSNRVYQDSRAPAEAFRMLKSDGNKFDDEWLGRFVESLGKYPVGSLVELNTGEVGFVIPDDNAKKKPSVLIVLDHHKRRYFPQRVRDLNRFPKFSIVNLLTSGAYGIDVDDYAQALE